jgi:hypothetical protein
LFNECCSPAALFNEAVLEEVYKEMLFSLWPAFQSLYMNAAEIPTGFQ